MALFSATGTVILNVLVAVHRETALYRNTLVFAVFSVLACFPLIGAYGYPGAAVAMVLASVGSQAGLALIPSTRDYVRPCLSAAARSIAAVALGVGVASSIDAGHMAGLAVAFTIYVLSLVVFGVLNRDEIRFMRTMLLALAGRREGAVS